MEESTLDLLHHEKQFGASLPELPFPLASGNAKSAHAPPAAFNSANHSPLSTYADDNYQGNDSIARNLGSSIGLGVEGKLENIKMEDQHGDPQDAMLQQQQYSDNFHVVNPGDALGVFDPMMVHPGFGYGQSHQYARQPRVQRPQQNNYRSPTQSPNYQQPQRNYVNQDGRVQQQGRFRDPASDIWRQPMINLAGGNQHKSKRNQDGYGQHPTMMELYPGQQGNQQGFHSSSNQVMVCRYFLNGYCSRGEQCNFLHLLPSPAQPGAIVRPQAGGSGQYVPQHVTYAGPLSTFQYAPFDAQTPLVALPGSFTYNMSPMTAMPQPHMKLPGSERDMSSSMMSGQRPIYSTSVPFTSQNRFSSGTVMSPQQPLQQQRRRMPFEEANRFMGIPLEELVGAIYAISRDQHGCRYLQTKLEEHNEKNLNLIFAEIYSHIGELMTDAFANYLCQKIFHFCSDEQRTVIVDAIAPDLVRISMNSHGTRAVQKLLDVLSSPEQIRKVVLALSTNVVALMKASYSTLHTRAT
ncbi:hypothetical protein SmJEL517_g03742 [Synchytrium microbalum]|uniref:C3H1-type domain-containing protein n=1 Tax=Synchytrium microbalum TaxID=1806994 RepID=A0A507C784_9FUNG|nr:uncharacterized protein SmJEL517_g03742 [Synchytrium microbalum]TPX33393.1 hypothetical protein SmJEL517_g03742 [Synchytrium microbalum]